MFVSIPAGWLIPIQGGAVFVTDSGEAAFNGNILFQDNYAVRKQELYPLESGTKAFSNLRVMNRRELMTLENIVP